jgi:P27 family predicted phage terminase small subunit
MAGQRQKHPDALAFKRGGRYQPLAPVAGLSIPEPICPPNVREDAKSVWRALWASPLAGAFKASDVPALRRWLWWLNEWLRSSEMMAESSPTIAGAKGPILNPLARYVKLCEASCRELEKAFGMDALSRLRLGLTLVEEQSAIAKLKQPAKPRAYADGGT